MMFTFLENTVIERFCLTHAIEFRNRYNESNGLPYHNNRHMDFVLQDCIEFYVWSLVNCCTPSTHYVQALFLAAIFHDVNHRGASKKEDHKNIELAKECVVQYFDTYHNEQYGYQSTDRRLRHTVLALIDATQYPYTPMAEDNELKYYQGVLRDADLMTVLHGEVGEQMSAAGLFDEIGYPQTYGAYEDYSVLNKKFLQSVTWNSSWAKAKKKKFEEAVERVCVLMKRLVCVP